MVEGNMKINETSSAKTASTENMQAKETEKKELASRVQNGPVDRFENSKTPASEGLPQRNDTIGGGYQRNEIPKDTNSRSEITKKTEDQPETPAWLKGKEHGRGIGWSKDVRPVDHSVTESSKVNNPLDNKGKKVGLDYFDKQNKVKEMIVADENSVRDFASEFKESSGNNSNPPAIKNPLDIYDGVPKGYGKNKSSKQEQTSMFGNTSLISIAEGSSSKTENAGSPSPTPYPKSEQSNTNDTSKFIETKRPEISMEIKPVNGNESGTLKEKTSGSVMKKDSIIINAPSVIAVLSTNNNFRTPTPDSVDDSHVPEAIRHKAPEREDRATKEDQVTLHDENKRQQEVVYVERQEIYGSMVGRRTDGRSTPAPTDGTTGSNGPSSSNGTEAVDVNILHPKGDPPDGEEV